MAQADELAAAIIKAALGILLPDAKVVGSLVDAALAGRKY